MKRKRNIRELYEEKSFVSDEVLEEKSPISAVRLRMPIGISDFEQLRTEKSLSGASFWFVDKILLIPEIMEGSAISLITRPRRFGKTLNLSMLRYFFDVRDAKRNRMLFNGLTISKNTAIMARQGQYPVIFLTLKDIDQNDFTMILTKFKETMSVLYEEHRYLLDEELGQLSSTEREFFERVRGGEINQSKLESSLQRLIIFLERHYKRKVVVLVDEYDSPLLSAFYGGFYDDFRRFYRNFFGAALKDNKKIYKAVLTGIAQIAGADLFSKFNNSTSYNILNKRYSAYFGFTEKEVKELLVAMGRPDRFTEMEAWYDGYRFGDSQAIYNPWSVLQYIDHEFDPQAYWVYTSDNHLLKKYLLNTANAVKADLVSLMKEGGTVEKTINRTLQFEDVIAKRMNSFWTLLLSSGYLKADIIQRQAASVLARISIPNREIRSVYATIFHDWLSKQMKPQVHNALIGYLRNGQIQAFCEGFSAFFSTTVSTHDVRKDYIEAFYHGFTLGMIELMMPTHTGHLRSNRESGLGRFDLHSSH